MEKLIEMVRGFPILYDTSHPDYMRSKLKDDLWEKVARELNYTDAKAAKEQWRKLRECHREALRRQEKKSGQQATHFRPWTFQKQMEFLRPFMKNRNTVGCPTSPLEGSQEEDDITLPSNIEEINDGEASETSGIHIRKKIKKSIIDPCMQQFIADSNMRAKRRDELRENLAAENQRQNDPLYQFFISMYNTTKNLPSRFQREVRKKLFQAVTEAEDKAEDEENKAKHAPTVHPADEMSISISQEFPEFFSPSNSTSVSSGEITAQSCSTRGEDDSPRTYFTL